MTVSFHHRLAHVNDIRLHYVETGSGTPVVFLHGFPDFWYGWRHQLRSAQTAGYRAVAPDLRGYNRSEKPSGAASYRLGVLVEDVAVFIRTLDAGPVALVGHDWGGLLTWYVGMHYPDLVRRIIVMNAAHPGTYAREIRRLSPQVWRSAYVLFFQLPWLPEELLSGCDFALLRRAWRAGPAPTEEDVRRYVEAFARPGALTGGLNHYRAAFRYAVPLLRPIHVPTLVIWGEKDPFQSPRLLDGLHEWVPDLHVERFPQAGHWVHHHERAGVNSLLLGFLERDAPW